MRRFLGRWLVAVVLIPASSAACDLGCDVIGNTPTPQQFGSPEPFRPTGDPDAGPPDAGPDLDTPDEACPLTTGQREWTASSPSVVRGILIRSSVLTIADRAPPTIPLQAFDLATGVAGSVTDVERPGGPNSTNPPRLQTVRIAGKDYLFVSYLRREYVEDDGGVVESAGGVVPVGPLDQPLPSSAALIPGVDDSVDGIFPPVDVQNGSTNGAVVMVLSWPSLGADAGSLRSARIDNGQVTLSPLLTRSSIPLAAASFARSDVVVYQGSSQTIIRADGDGEGGWRAFAVGPRGTDDFAPGKVVTWAPLSWRTSADDLNATTFFGVSPEGVVTRYTPAMPTRTRELTVLPPGFRAAASSARMVHTNGTQGSLVFPGFKNDAPRMFRIHIHSGKLEEWAETATDTPDAAFGWSALAADRGLVCYSSSANVIRCGCMDSVFKPVY